MDLGNKRIVFGAPYSVYVCAVRLALEEKGVGYELVPVDIFATDGPPAEHLARHPFGKIPAFEHAGFRLYETGAITRYVDEVFDGPPLQPAGPRGRARMNQIISILDNYAYRTLVWDIYVERVVRSASGVGSDEERIAAALPKAEVCLSALDEMMADAPWLTGPTISLGDLHAAPIFAAFLRTPEGRDLVSRHDRLARWWDRMSARQSFVRTTVPPRHNSTASETEPRWLTIARELQAISQTGLHYTKDKYDAERFARLRVLASEMLALHSDAPFERIVGLFSGDIGYSTPKIDVRGAIFRDSKILMVREVSDGRWSLPGGWADVNCSISQSVAREIFEESGFTVHVTKLVAAWDRSLHGHRPGHPYSVLKLFFLCELTGGMATLSQETSEVGFFGEDELPELSIGRVQTHQIRRMFAHHRQPDLPTEFD